MKKYMYGVLSALVFMNALAWPYVLAGQHLRVTFFDVGQGDSIFIETPQGHQILIDGGPSRKVAEKIGKTLPFWDKSLDLAILTHADSDHITGLVDVFEAYEVQGVLWTGVENDTNIFAQWERAVEEEKSAVRLARGGEKLVWSKRPDEFLEIVSPNRDVLRNSREINDTSIVALLRYGEHSFLLPGDITKIVEQELIAQGIDIGADVLKVPHHGSKFSSSENFLAAVSPHVAVIQVGKNSYGHPTQEVLERLAGFGIPVLRSDRNGDILITSDGTSLRIR